MNELRIVRAGNGGWLLLVDENAYGGGRIFFRNLDSLAIAVKVILQRQKRIDELKRIAEYGPAP